MKKLYLDQTQVKYLGRYHYLNHTLWLSFSGSGVSFSYTGKTLEVTIQGGKIALTDNNHARLAIVVDGKRVVDDMVTYQEKTYTLTLQGDSPAMVEILKLTESPMSVLGIAYLGVEEDGVITAAPYKEALIEFIGDSITCGYGVDDEDPLHPFTTKTEDVTRAYAYKTAKALGMDYSMVSFSGYGIISGYVNEPTAKLTTQLVPDFYETMGYSDDVFGVSEEEYIRPHAIPWDFTKRQPNVIVVNLGTNDDSYCQDMVDRQEEYTREYVNFLKVIRSHNQNAKIFCALGLMGDRLFPSVEKAVEQFKAETQDEMIYAVHLPEQDASVGYVSDYHPLESAHEKAAAVLVEGILEHI